MRCMLLDARQQCPIRGVGQAKNTTSYGTMCGRIDITWGLHTGIAARRYLKGDLQNVCRYVHQNFDGRRACVRDISVSLGPRLTGESHKCGRYCNLPQMLQGTNQLSCKHTDLTCQIIFDVSNSGRIFL